MHARKFIRCTLLTGLLALAPSGHADEAPDYSGAELFHTFCASCHGAQARGDGPVARSLKVKVPDLTGIARRHGGFPAELVGRIIDGRELRPAHGSDTMPVWGQEFYGADGDDAARRARSDELIGKLVDYLRSIQR